MPGSLRNLSSEYPWPTFLCHASLVRKRLHGDQKVLPSKYSSICSFQEKITLYYWQYLQFLIYRDTLWLQRRGLIPSLIFSLYATMWHSHAELATASCNSHCRPQSQKKSAIWQESRLLGSSCQWRALHSHSLLSLSQNGCTIQRLRMHSSSTQDRLALCLWWLTPTYAGAILPAHILAVLKNLA